MRKRLTFSKLLANDKLMMVVSLILAVAIWASVLAGPAYIEEREITVDIKVDLTNSYAYQSGIRVIGETDFSAVVNVSGALSVISKLDASDFRVRPDLTVITGAGDFELPLNVSRNSTVTDYEILSVTPSTVSVACDYWQEGVRFKLLTDVSALKAADPEKLQIGEPVIEQTAFPDGYLTIDGPKTVIDKINSLVARIAAEEELTQTKQYQVPVVALDENGNELDLTDCSIEELPDGTVAMTVPLWEERHVTFGYNVINQPEDDEGLLIVTPESVDLLGPSADLDALEEQLRNLGTVDFAKLSLTNDTVTFPLNIPSTVRAIDNPTEMTVSLDSEGLSQKTMTVTATAENTVLVGSSSYELTVPQQTFENVLLVGSNSSINRITAEDITLEIDAGESPTPGTKQYVAKLKINNFDDVWVCYGPENDGITMYAALS